MRELIELLKEKLVLPHKEMLTIEELSVFSGLSKSWLYKKTSKQQIPHYKVGERLMFDKKEILEWMHQNKVC